MYFPIIIPERDSKWQPSTQHSEQIPCNISSVILTKKGWKIHAVDMMSSALFERVLKGRGTKFRDIVLDQQGSEFFANVNEVTYVNNSHTSEDGPESSRQPPLHSTFNVGSASESSDQSGDPLSKDSSQHM